MEFFNYFYNYGKKENKCSNYKSLINFLRKIKFTDKEHYLLLKADAYANNNLIDDGIDFFKHLYNFELNIPQLQYKLFIPYIMEKLIVFSDERGDKSLFKYDNISKIYNTFNELNNFSYTQNNNFLQKFMFMMSYEQINIQENNYITNMLRLKKLYQDVEEVNELIKINFGINFNKFLFLHWVLFTYIVKNKKTTIYFNIKNFISFATKNKDFNISEQEINNFLEYVLISKEEFKNKYLKIRKNQTTGKFISYDKLTYIDRYLPRISYWYPLIKVNNQMKLISYTSLLEFMKFDKLYSFIYHNKYIKNFKLNIHGYCVEKYIKEYAKSKVKNAKIYGDEPYEIGKNQYKAPDIIIEFETYVIIIEAKSKPFNILEALSNFDNYGFNKIIEERDKSIKNINRYLKNKNSFNGKKIYKFICYFFDYPSMLSSLDDIDDLENIIVTDIVSIENLLSIKNESYDKIIEKYLEERKRHQTSSLSHFCINHYDEKKDDDNEFKNFIRKFIKKDN
jgi:hypothetical protein